MVRSVAGAGGHLRLSLGYAISGDTSSSNVRAEMAGTVQKGPPTGRQQSRALASADRSSRAKIHRDVCQQVRSPQPSYPWSSPKRALLRALRVAPWIRRVRPGPAANGATQNPPGIGTSRSGLGNDSV